MSKKDGRGRIRVFFAEIEGDDATIQDGLRALTGAVSKTFQPKVVMLPAHVANSEGEPIAIEHIDELVEEADHEESSAELPAKKKATNSKSKPPKFTLVKELDLRPDGEVAFRDFFFEKSPKTQNEQIAVIVYYLKQKLNLEEVSTDHVYTCLKDADVKVPTHLPSVIRNCASMKGWVDSSSSHDLKITTSGENFVEHDLPHGVT